MGTNYVVHSDEHHQISVDEHSNRFTLMASSARPSNTEPGASLLAYDPVSGSEVWVSHVDTRHHFDEKQLVDMALHMLQIALYWHSDGRAAHEDIKQRVGALIA